MKFAPILFDLDGTVADTHGGITVAIDATLAELGLPPFPPKLVYSMTGKGVNALISGVLAEVGADPELLERAVALYRARYEKTCAEGVEAYPGVMDLLRRLPRPLALLTNKPRRFTERIVSALGLEQAFDALVAGDDPGARLKPDPWPLQEALRRVGGGPRPLMVGDSASDVKAAAAAGIESCLARWGFKPTPVTAPASYQARSVDELEALLRG